MKKIIAGTTLILLMALSGCSTMETSSNWLSNAQKIDEENNHK